MNVYANYTYTRALQDSGANRRTSTFPSTRATPTRSARATSSANWAFNLSSTHQSGQFSDTANTVAESASAAVGLIPGFRLWNAQLGWKMAARSGAWKSTVGVNNLADKRYFTRTTDTNAGKLVGAPRTVYVQGRMTF